MQSRFFARRSVVHHTQPGRCFQATTRVQARTHHSRCCWAHKLLEAVKGHRLELLYQLALSLGMREGELLGLRWLYINFKEQQLRIVQMVEDIRGVGRIGSPKTDHAIRKLPLPHC